MNTEQSLAAFGLDSQERTVYLTLLKENWVTVLQLSQLVEIKRPTLYRVLERLTKRGLAETQLDDKTTYYNAASPEQFTALVTDQEQKLNSMKSISADLVRNLKLATQSKNNQTTVRFFRGQKALQYMEYKKCENKGTEILIIDTNNWTNIHSREFTESIRQGIVEAGIIIRELQNPGDIAPVAPDGKTDWTDNIDYVNYHFRHREISEKIIKITQDIYVFDGYIHLHGYRDHELIGIEIYNPDYAGMLRMIFELLWNQARIVDDYGNGIRRDKKD